MWVSSVIRNFYVFACSGDVFAHIGVKLGGVIMYNNYVLYCYQVYFLAHTGSIVMFLTEFYDAF